MRILSVIRIDSYPGNEFWSTLSKTYIVLHIFSDELSNGETNQAINIQSGAFSSRAERPQLRACESWTYQMPKYVAA